MKWRVVLDTNCLIAALPRRSSYHNIWKDFVDGEYELCVTNEILAEYEEILSNKSSSDLAGFVIDVIVNSSNAVFVSPSYRFNLIKADVDDNKFVDCAITANAQFIVSEDKHFRVLRSIAFPQVNVIGIKRFLQMLDGGDEQE
ncbi:MAG: putative toxin-antitoxin system toxin component, PIN family [Prevotellaceae bacterium]|nr:putative toxin-antitoxin system toxin component, PIN family [Prevotellaceae bacterium]